MAIAGRVAITGIGLVTPLGIGVEAVRESLAAGTIAISDPPAGVPASLGIRRAAPLHGFDASARLRQRKNEKFMGRSALLVANAAHLAVADAGLDPAHDDFAEIGLFVGTTLEDRGIDDFAGVIAAGRERADEPWDPATLGRSMRAYDPDTMLRSLSSMLVGHAAIELGTMGPNAAVTPSWIAGGQAIAAAVRALEGGVAIAIAGGGDGKLDLPGLAQLQALGVLGVGERGGGLVLGEGAVLLVLEREASARARGARSYGLVLGFAEQTRVEPSARVAGYAATMRQALAIAGLASHDIDAVRGDPPGLVALDDAEAIALAEVFGGEPPPRTSIGARTGHLLSAALPLELAAALLEPAGPRRMLCSAWGPPGQHLALVVERAEVSR